jgi:hypothetical protein
VTVGRRSQVDQRLAEEFANGKTAAAAAEAAGCSVRTAERRWAEPAFRDLVIRLQEDARKEREALLRTAWDSGGRLVRQAMLALQDVFQDPNASHLDKTRAARLVLRAYGPKEEPPPLKIPTVEEEQRAAAVASEIARLMAANVVDMAAHRPPPPPAWTPPPQPPQPARPPVAIPVEPYGQLHDDDDPEDPEDPEPAEIRPAATVGQEYAKELPSEPRGTPEPAADPVDETAEALRYLRDNPRRPPAGPELMAWLQARRVAGLDQEPQPMRRRRRRGR